MDKPFKVFVVTGHWINLNYDEETWIEDIYVKESDAIDRVLSEKQNNTDVNQDYRYEEWELK